VLPGHGDGRIELPVKRLGTVMKELGHERLDVLKLDIEGAEYAVLDDLLAIGVLPQQLLVEFHHGTGGVALETTEASLDRLLAAGYRVFDARETGREFSLVSWQSAPIARHLAQCPAPLQHENQPRVRGYVVVADGRDRRTRVVAGPPSRDSQRCSATFHPRNPTICVRKCENPRALTHPGHLPGWWQSTERATRNSAASMGQRPYAIIPLSFAFVPPPTSDKERTNRMSGK
jgi:hypothetical protein